MIGIRNSCPKFVQKMKKKRVSVSGIRFGSDTEIGPWFRFPIPKPGFGCKLTLVYKTVSAPVIAFKHI